MKIVFVVAGALVMLGGLPLRAADLGGIPTEEPFEPVAAYATPWSGRYIGLDLGAAFTHGADAKTIGTPDFVALIPLGIAPASIDLDRTSFSAAGQLGINWQSGSLVYGIEGELAYVGIETDESFTGVVPVLGTTLTTAAGYDVGANVNLRGRVGALVTPSFLLYVQGGLALADIETRASVVSVDVPGLEWSGDTQEFRAGYTLGAGAEWLLGDKTSLKVSYNFYDYGTAETAALGNAAVRAIGALDGIDYLTETDLQYSTIRAGLNYKF